MSECGGVTMSTSIATTGFVRHKPIIALHPLNAKIPNFPTSKFDFSREFLISGIVWRQPRSWASKTGSRPMELSAFRDNSNSFDGESVGLDGGALEQEGLVHGSGRFPPDRVETRFESTLNSMSKWLVTAIFVSLVVIRHDGKVLWATMGLIMNVLLCNLLKTIINQERPVSGLKPDPGMPSSHAQSFSFIFLFAIISMIELLGTNALTIALSALSLAIGAYLSWLRVSQKFHTISQVVVGAALGSIFFILWFWLWDAFVHEAFVSTVLVRILVLLGAAAFGIGFTIHVIQNWIMDRK